MEPIIDHIEITVRDMSVAVPFYDKLLPLLGFDLGKKGSASYEHPRLGFAITSPRRAFTGEKDPDGIKYEIVSTGDLSSD